MEGYKKEFKALYLSIAVMSTSQTENIKTDLIIFTPKEAFSVPLSVGCVTNVRKTFADEEQCIVIEHLPVKQRPTLKNEPPGMLLHGMRTVFRLVICPPHTTGVKSSASTMKMTAFAVGKLTALLNGTVLPFGCFLVKVSDFFKLRIHY